MPAGKLEYLTFLSDSNNIVIIEWVTR